MKKKIFKSLTIFSLSLFLVLPLMIAQAEAKTFRLTIGSGHPADAAIWAGQVRDFFAPEVKKRVEETTEHKIMWIDAYGGSVAKLGEVLEAVQDNILNVGLIVNPFEPVKMYLHNWCYYVPFGSPDVQQVARVSLKIFDKFPYLTEVFEKDYNQKFVGAGTISSYHLITTFPWDNVSQLKGRKIAAAGPNLPWVEAVGAVPVQSNLNEAYTSLQTGVYDGWVMNVDATVGFKLFEPAPNFAFTDFGSISVACLTVNLDTWNSLPKEVQDIMIQVGREYNEMEAKAAQAKLERGLETMEKAGVKLIKVPFEEKVKWAAMMPEIPAEKAKEADGKGMPGTEVIKAYIEELEKEGFKFPRRWVLE